ncbi:MAG: DUF418 domain-containing protein [Chitinophagaceae bacterium]|nr:DUF418 domain-containing protein [Chitinophagaceae bacterium]
MNQLAPVQAAEREKFMDVLRGFAILGIFIANLGSGLSWYNESAHMTGPMLMEGWDHKMLFLHHMFIEGKFYSIFSLLFGWGIALQIKRGLAKDINPIPTIRRRLFFMLILGAVHLLIWNGDIVFFYAMLGFLLIPLRKFSNKTLLVTGAVLILTPILFYWLKMEYPVLNYPAEKMNELGIKVTSNMLPIKSEEDYMALMQHGSWWDQFKVNVGGVFFRYGYLFFVSRIPKVVGMFLIGYVIGRTDFYKNIVQHKKLLYYLIGIGIVVGLPANYYLAYYMTWHDGDYYGLKTNGLYQTIFYAVGVVPLALLYVSVFMLSFQANTGRKILSVLAPVGKMAFSNYIMQSLIGNFVFLGAGLGYMGTVGPVYYTMFGILVFIGQIIISTIWLKYFNYGPLEWLWRSATYSKWQVMKKTDQ